MREIAILILISFSFLFFCSCDGAKEGEKISVPINLCPISKRQECFINLYAPDMLELNKDYISGNLYFSPFIVSASLEKGHLKLAFKNGPYSESEELKVAFSDFGGFGNDYVTDCKNKFRWISFEKLELSDNNIAYENPFVIQLTSMNRNDIGFRKIYIEQPKDNYCNSFLLLYTIRFGALRITLEKPKDSAWHGVARIEYYIEFDNERYAREVISGKTKTWFVIDNSNCAADESAECANLPLEPPEVKIPLVTDADMSEKCGYDLKNIFDVVCI